MKRTHEQIATIRATHHIEAVANDLGIRLAAGQAGRAQMQAHCFDAAAHSNGDSTPSLRLYSDGHWHCHGCRAHGGDVIDLVRAVQSISFGAACDFLEGARTSPAVLPSVVTRRGYPPMEDVRDVFRQLREITAASDVGRYIMGRNVYAPFVSELGQALELPRSADHLPQWAEHWPRYGLRLIVPLVDHDGQLRSVRARRIVTSNGRPKSMTPTGFATTGLVMAGCRECDWLAGGRDAPPVLVIAEGEIDLLHWGESHLAIGISAGSWSEEYAKKIPHTTLVVVATHADVPGEKYYRDILATLRRGVRVKRWKARETKL